MYDDAKRTLFVSEAISNKILVRFQENGFHAIKNMKTNLRKVDAANAWFLSKLENNKSSIPSVAQLNKDFEKTQYYQRRISKVARASVDFANYMERSTVCSTKEKRV